MRGVRLWCSPANLRIGPSNVHLKLHNDAQGARDDCPIPPRSPLQKIIGGNGLVVTDTSPSTGEDWPKPECDAACGTAGCKAGSTTQCCDAACLGGCNVDNVCNACAENKLLRNDGACADTCTAGTFAYGFKVRNIDR